MESEILRQHIQNIGSLPSLRIRISVIKFPKYKQIKYEEINEANNVKTLLSINKN
jgi:hypothetical protein